MIHVMYMNESRHTYEQVSHVTHMDEQEVSHVTQPRAQERTNIGAQPP